MNVHIQIMKAYYLSQRATIWKASASFVLSIGRRNSASHRVDTPTFAGIKNNLTFKLQKNRIFVCYIFEYI